MAGQNFSITLLAAAAVTGGGVAVDTPGEYCLSVAGTFGGAAFGVDKLGPDGVTWIALKDAAGAIALTSADALILSLSVGSYRGRVTGGAGVSLTAKLEPAG